MEDRFPGWRDKLRRSIMLAALASIVLSGASSNPSHAAFLYQFSTTTASGGVPGPFPGISGSLGINDAAVADGFVDSFGDLDSMAFSVGASTINVPLGSLGGGSLIEVDLVGDGLSGSIMLGLVNDTIFMSTAPGATTWSGLFFSDNPATQCQSFGADCEYEGEWRVVPEPSSLAIFFSALLFMPVILSRRFSRSKHPGERRSKIGPAA